MGSQREVSHTKRGQTISRRKKGELCEPSENHISKQSLSHSHSVRKLHLSLKANREKLGGVGDSLGLELSLIGNFHNPMTVYSKQLVPRPPPAKFKDEATLRTSS
jgi:hypothetical protein